MGRSPAAPIPTIHAHPKTRDHEQTSGRDQRRLRQLDASWSNDGLAAKVSPLVVNLKRLMMRANPGAELHRQLRNFRPDNDAKTILFIN
jgi:hypothetical protein